jgi:hypothetical protein
MNWGRLAIVLAAVLSMAAVPGVAQDITLDEEETGVQHRVNPWTGETEIAFYVILNYSEGVHCPELVFEWEVFVVEGGQETLLDAYTREQRFRSCVGALHQVRTHSDYVVPVPGQRYKAKVVVDDAKHEVRYEKTLDYTVPVGFPAGIGVYAKIEDEVVMGYDLSGLSTKALEDLTRILDTLRADYVQTASETVFGSFFSGYVTPDAVFPAEVLVLPALPQAVGESDTGARITVSYNRMLLTFPVPSADAVAGVSEQVRGLEQEFIGDVLLYDGEPEDPIVPRAVFVHATVWEVLEEAKAELATREEE